MVQSIYDKPSCVELKGRMMVWPMYNGYLGDLQQ